MWEVEKITHYTEGTIFIEIREIYYGSSVAELPDGSLINMWPVTDRRYKATQNWIENNVPSKSMIYKDV